MNDPLIQIIEDDKDVAELYSHALKSSGIEAEIVQIGEDALARLAVTVPNLVLLELKLQPHKAGTAINPP